ncbi:MAG: urate hydroxylase PuuD, partial [Gammaproteobacteria bacterium]
MIPAQRGLVRAKQEDRELDLRGAIAAKLRSTHNTYFTRDSRALGAVLAVLLSTAAWGLCRLFSGRGAYMEFGAMLGTIMVANVFFVIIPAQRALVRAKEEDREPDLRGAIAAKLRSTHNTYFTLPVLFVMISPHYPITYGAREYWLVLIVICAAGV